MSTPTPYTHQSPNVNPQTGEPTKPVENTFGTHLQRDIINSERPPTMIAYPPTPSEEGTADIDKSSTNQPTSRDTDGAPTLNNESSAINKVSAIKAVNQAVAPTVPTPTAHPPDRKSVV